MASSRWKRFAFFDRNNLTLPDIVQKDVIPTNLFPAGDNKGKDSVGAGGQSSSSRSSASLKGDSVSLAVVNGAGVPFASIPEEPSNLSSSVDQSIGVSGMIQTLKVCLPQHHGGSSVQEGGNPKKSNSFQFSSTGQTVSVPAYKKSGNVDGSLVLAFLSSKTSQHVHCIDLTVRCNPLQKNMPKKSGGNDLYASSGLASGGSSLDNRTSKEHADRDGWRGFFRPFAHDYSDDSREIVTAANKTPTTATSKVVSVAVCSDHESDNIKAGKNIYVASVTDNLNSVGVTVHRNPHLYLNGASGLDSSHDGHASAKILVTPNVECFQPFGKFDHKNRGRPVSVDVQNGLVAIGTDTGMVIIYSFNTRMSTIKADNGTGSMAMGGYNGTNKLSVLMEIPPPHATGDEGKPGAYMANQFSFAASCVKLVCDKVVGKNGKKNNSNVKGERSNSTAVVNNARLFVTYRRSVASTIASIQMGSSGGANARSQNAASVARGGSSSSSSNNNSKIGGGVCCYDLDGLNTATPNARYDLDGREVISSCLCDVVNSRKNIGHGSANSTHGSATTATSPTRKHNKTAVVDTVESDKFMIARSDGLYTYSSTDKISVSPIDGTKIAMCSIPPPSATRRRYRPQRYLHGEIGLPLANNEDVSDDGGESKIDPMQGRIEESIMNMQVPESGASYVLIATTDSKSGRDAVDIYDTSNKLVAFHLLLSPGHRALRSTGITTTPKPAMDGNTRGGLSSAIVLTSGGSLVTLTEKVTGDKVSLLVQKNLYAAAISMAFADPSYEASDITALFRRHAEHLYRKNDFSAAMDQYIYTIGSLEPSHVIFRFLDAPKIPLLTKYLEELRSQGIATSVHSELLKTCYLKLNDVGMAEKISASLSKSMTFSTCNSVVANLLHSPTEALATICSFDAQNVVDALRTHGPILAKALPKETAGLVISLCDGVYVPSTQMQGNQFNKSRTERHRSGEDILVESLESSNRTKTSDMYPITLFSSAFLENPKLLRVILAHCVKNKRNVGPPLKRMLLELTLEEWNIAKRLNDIDKENGRRSEAISMLSDPYTNNDLGDYEALVIVQRENFTEGMIMLYEKLQMLSSSIEAYAKDGSYKARRQMLALCRSDPELLADVLGHFVQMAVGKNQLDNDEVSINSESDLGELLEDIKEALAMARSQGVLPPVRVARILAGDGVGQFSEERTINKFKSKDDSVPLSVALDYIGAVMDDSSKEIDTLKDNVEDYNRMCNAMEAEVNELLSFQKSERPSTDYHSNRINIDEMYAMLLDSLPDNSSEKKSEVASESFWRDMSHSQDRFETIARFFAKDILGG
mmetsp:Transcript_27771/g.42540  ORF Transcript_27771/g.42540 Transcript_27771/m.42540 type:complete len:1320 (+) Transcript_27771:112-4071(+)